MTDIERKRLYGLIGISAKAGKVQSGEFCTEKSIKSGKAKLVIVAKDASENTKKKFTDMAERRKIPISTEVCDKDTLGHIIGREFRASITIENKGLAENILSLMNGGNANGDR